MFNAILREGLRRQSPDPGFWVKWRDWKFYADSNVVYVEGHEHLPFILPAEVKILQSYPQGVRADDGHGNHYLIHGGPEVIHLYITVLMDEDVKRLDEGNNYAKSKL